MANATQPVLTPATGSRARSILLGLLAMGISFAVAFSALEAGVRILMPQNTRFFDASELHLNPWEFRPGAEHPSYIGVPVRINNVGFRGPDVTIPKPADTVRILAVGDSVTFGYGLRYENTFSNLIQQMLNSRANGARKYEVIDGGVPATGLDYYEYCIRRHAKQLQADVVLVAMAMNDIADYSSRPPGPPPHRGRRLDAMLMRYSHLYNFAYFKAKSVLYGLGILDLGSMHDSDFLPILPDSADRRAAFASTGVMLGRISAATRDSGAKLVVALFPMEPQLSEAGIELYKKQFHLALNKVALQGDPQKLVAQDCEKDGVPFVDLLPAFRSAQNGQPLFLRNKSISYDPVHPSVAGNRIAAESFAAAISQLH